MVGTTLHLSKIKVLRGMVRIRDHGSMRPPQNRRLEAVLAHGTLPVKYLPVLVREPLKHPR